MGNLIRNSTGSVISEVNGKKIVINGRNVKDAR